MKKLSLLFGAFILFAGFFAGNALAFNEVCGTNVACCTPPRSITEGGGCPAGEVWIGGVIDGSCEVAVACGVGRIFQCATNTCDSSGNACTTTAVETTICCADGQVAVRDDLSVTGWSCAANGGGSSVWDEDAFGPYVLAKQVGVGQNTGASSYSLAVKADGNNAATAGAIIANATLINAVGINATGARAGGIFSGDNGIALEVLNEDLLQVLSDPTEVAATVVGYFQAVDTGSSEVLFGSKSDHNLSIMRGGLAFIELVNDGIRNYVQMNEGTDAEVAVSESGFLIISDPFSRHLAIDDNGIVAKTTDTLPATLELNLGSTGNVTVNMEHNSFGSTVCRNGEILGYCASLLELKESITDLSFGLKEVMQLRPKTFKWKDKSINNGELDFGFIAQEVEVVDSLFAEYDDEGELRGVKYRQLTALLTKAIQEQQGMIEMQQKEIETLKELVCLEHPEALTCKRGL